MGVLIKADATQESISPTSGKAFSLEELQGFVGGYIEHIVITDGRDSFINEEGKLKGLLYNSYATELYSNPHDVICGDMIVCETGEVE